MKNVIFIMFFILSNNYIFPQNFGLTAKYNTHMGSSYNTYTSFSFEGLFSFYNNMFEVGPLVGVVYSEPKPTFDNISPGEHFYTDVVDIAKTVIGGNLYFYPITFDSTYSPFLGIRFGKLNNMSKSFVYFFKNGANMVTQSGLYNFKTIDDFTYSFLSGVKILTTKGFNFFLELEYQHREFTLEYDEYWEYPIDEWIEHSEKMSINAFNFGIGLQFVF